MKSKKYIEIPENQKVLKYLKHKGSKYTSIIESPEQVKDPYLQQGSHPEIVERVWDKISESLPQDCRILIFGTPCLVNPKNGIIFGICNGTQYNLRLTKKDLLSFTNNELKTTNRWSNGNIMDTKEQLGEQWIFGEWKDEEIEWCVNSYNEKKI